MRLMDLLRDELVVVGLKSRTRDEALAELVAVLIREGEVAETSRRSVLDAIVAREASHTTGLGHGVAVPHGLTEAVEEVRCVLGLSTEGVDFAAIDKAPSRIVVLLVVPKNRFQAHVRTLAGIARLLNDHSLRERLLAAGTSEEAMDVIVDAEEAIARDQHAAR